MEDKLLEPIPVDRADYAFWHALCAFRPFIGANKLHELINLSGNIKDAWEAGDEFLQRLGWSKETMESFEQHRNHWQVDTFFKRLDALNINFIPSIDTDFPDDLRKIFDPPLGLYYRGYPFWKNNQLTVAFVGSRKASPYGKTATNMIVQPLAARGAMISSGLAYGIDAEAHTAALSVHGTTFAVIGNGCDEQTMYPRAHRELARRIIDQGGAIISEYPPGTKPQPYFFPQRNRLISGLSQAIVVVEAAKQSGALITARLGLEQNKEIFAVPGPITSDLSWGTNSLIREGATPIQSADDIMECLELNSLFQVKLNPITQGTWQANESDPNRNLVLSLLSGNPTTIDEIVKRSTLSPNTVASTITMLEIENSVKDIGGKNYVRI